MLYKSRVGKLLLPKSDFIDVGSWEKIMYIETHSFTRVCQIRISSDDQVSK